MIIKLSFNIQADQMDNEVISFNVQGIERYSSHLHRLVIQHVSHLKRGALLVPQLYEFGISYHSMESVHRNQY